MELEYWLKFVKKVPVFDSLTEGLDSTQACDTVQLYKARLALQYSFVPISLAEYSGHV